MNTSTRWSGVKMTPGCSWPGTWLTGELTPVPGKACFAGSSPRSITTLERCDGFRPRVNQPAGGVAPALYGLDMSHQVHGGPAQRRCHGRHHVCSLRRVEAVGEAGQFVEALGEAEPGRAAVREQEAGPVGELEVGSRRETRVIGSYGKPGEQEAERLDGLEHEADGGGGQDLALFGRLMAEGEVARDHLQHELIGGVEQVGAAA